jgi:hypothetical protein
LQAGQWSIAAQPAGSVLQLQYPDGTTQGYELTTNERGHTLLDGDRWFVVSCQECADL